MVGSSGITAERLAPVTASGRTRLPFAAGTVVVYERNDVVPESVGPPPLQPQRPVVALNAEEALALITFRERSVYWSDARRAEIADHLQALTNSTGVAGVTKLMAMAHWLQEKR
jgi:hypothetical protein